MLAMPSRSVRISAFAVSLLALATLTPKVGAAVRIGGSSFSANGQIARDYQYTGACPVDLKFDWGVQDTSRSSIAYSITRSDGPRITRSLNHPGGNRSVPIADHWRLGNNSPRFRDFRGWEELNIESPNRAAKRIEFTIHCR